MNGQKIHHNAAAKNWARNRDGLAAMEFALVFPILLTLLMGVVEFGTAFIVNQKVITSSQIMADLISRDVAMTQADLDDIVDAGRLALAPYSTESFAYDIVSLQFAEDEEIEVCWRMTDNMDADDRAIEGTAPLHIVGEGVVVVTVRYDYEPYFASRVLDTLLLQERAHSRGRRVPVVSWDDGDGEIGCPGAA